MKIEDTLNYICFLICPYDSTCRLIKNSPGICVKRAQIKRILKEGEFKE